MVIDLHMKVRFLRLFLLCVLFPVVGMVTFACNSSTPENGTLMSEPAKSTTPTSQLLSTSLPLVPTRTSLPALTATLVPTATSTSTSTSFPTLTPSTTPLPTITPTYSILRGRVLEQANCRYGPGAAYLYKYGLYPGNNVEIIGRNEQGSWIVIQAIGGSNPCWVKASLLDIRGEAMSLSPASLPLPHSPYYGPLSGANAQRSGDDVVISWNPMILRAGDDSLQYPYLIEAWLCQDGQLQFTPIGTWETFLTVQDESGCVEPSHARIYGVEKHGYTSWVEIPWPQP